MEKEYVTVEVCYLTHSPSGLAVFVAMDDSDLDESTSIPLAVIHEDSVTELENADYADTLDIEVAEDFATANGLI